MTTPANDLPQDARRLGPRDPWERAPASWVPLPGDRAARALAQQFQKPLMWEHIVRPEDRALVAQLAGEVLEREPGVGYAFGGRLLERLRARRDQTRHPAQREPLNALEMILSRELHLLPDLRDRAIALRAQER